MALITGLTAARMLLIEGSSIVGASISNYVLTLTRQNGTTINLGNIRGATGATGNTGNTGPAGGILTVNGRTDSGAIVLTGTDIPQASETARGSLEIATTAEVAARTDNTRAVTPFHLLDYPGIPWAIAAGQLAPVSLAAASQVIKTITLPTGRFTQPPIVTVSAIGNQLDTDVTLDSVTTTAASVRHSNRESGTARTVGVNWMAVQMTSAAAGG